MYVQLRKLVEKYLIKFDMMINDLGSPTISHLRNPIVHGA